MSFQLKVTDKTLTGAGPGIYISGPYVTPDVHSAISTLMSANDIRDPFYKARQGVGAFFQGGHGDPNGQFVFIECWLNKNPEAITEFEKQLNKAVRGRIPEELTEIRLYPDTEGTHYLFTEIAKETNCRHSGSSLNAPMCFHPSDNDQWWKVYNLCKHMGLNVTYPVF